MVAKKGFFGLFNKDNQDDQPVINANTVQSSPVDQDFNNSSVGNMEDKVTVAKDVLTEILDLMGFFNVVKVREADEEVVFDIQGDDLGRIIGKDGSTLQALQQVLRAIINKRFKEPFSFVVDANDYREKRTQLLERLALNAAEKALHHHREVELEPMSANERRIIHMVLKDKDVRTESRGEKSQRHIVIMPAA